MNVAWPWTFLPGRPERSSSLPSGLTIDVAPSHVAEPAAVPGYASDSLQVFGRLQVAGIPDDRAAEALVMRSDLSYPGEAPVRFEGPGPDAAQAWLSPRWDPDLVRRVLGSVVFINPERAPTSPPVLSVVKRSVYEGHRGMEGTYQALINKSLLRYEVSSGRPLMREAHSDGLSRVDVLGVEREGATVVVVARETFLQLLFRGEPKWFGASMWTELGRRTLYVLRNRNRSEALWPTHDPFADVDPLVLFEIVSDRSLKHHVRRLVYEGPAPISQEWLRHAELVRIEAHEVETASRDIVVKPFVLPPSLK